jgi:acyl-CoA thioesterase II
LTHVGSSLTAALDVLSNIRTTTDGFEVDTLPTGHGGVLGAHLLFQQVLVAELAVPGRRVLELQTSFIRTGHGGEPAVVTVEKVQEGRSFTFVEMTFRQRGVVTCRSDLLLTVDEEDYLRVQAGAATSHDFSSWDDQLGMWPGSRRLEPTSNRTSRKIALQLDQPVAASTTRALLAMSTEPEVHSALFMPEVPGERAISPAEQASFVLKQTVTFLEEADLRSGVVIATVANYAGRGRSHGHGQLLDRSGRLLGTFSLTGVMRSRVR